MREPAVRCLDAVAMLRDALREVGENYTRSGKDQPESSVIVEGAPRLLSASAIVEIDRIAREAIRNCYQHGRARRVEAEIGFSKTRLRLSIRDDGIGIDPEILSKGSRDGHWGLTGMRERAGRLHARIDIWSKPGAGTEVELSVPAQIAFQQHAAVARISAPASHGGNHDEQP
jgi:signal transduction histidine kinase